MFNNIGRKIKTFAKVMCWIGIIASVVAGLVMIATSFSSYAPAAGIVTGILTAVLGSLFSWVGSVTVFGGIGVALLGSLLSWVGSFLMVGFGELVENTAEIAANTRKNDYNNY